MNTKYLVVVAAMAVMLVTATTLATTDNAFADRKRHDDRKDGGYGKSQSLAQASECGNGFISVADFCQEIGSQNQGKENSVAQSGNQEINVAVDLEDDVVPVPPDDVGCPDETVWDITIRGAAEEGGVPVGTVICLTEGLGNHPATVLLTPPIVVDVNTNQPNVANCNAPGQQVAEVTSGTPPNPLTMGSFLCATVDLP
jgi:hypothetical protein